MRRPPLLVSLAIIAAGWSASAADYTQLTPGVTLQTGDSWVGHGERYRLYGVQSCLRGTSFTDRAGHKQDCGEASLAVLAAFIKDLHPRCAPVIISEDTQFVLCYGMLGDKRLDLATALITEGYAFAALDANGLPIHPPYAVAEQEARARGKGLWQFADVEHPALRLSRAARQREGR